MTECNQVSFGFARHFSRAVKADFAGGAISSDGGALLLREAERRLDLVKRFVGCFQDGRDPRYVVHRLPEMVRQRVYGLVLGYEDLNDHEQLRHDPLLALLAGKEEIGQEPLAGKSTLNRLELAGEKPDRYKKVLYDQAAIDQLLVDVFLEAHEQAPERMVLDLDVTDLALHGHQEGRFFHGYYDNYCYLPLYIFCGPHLLGVRLRQANQDAAAGCKEELQRVGVCPQLEAAGNHRTADGPSYGSSPAKGPTGTRVYRVPLSDGQRQLGPSAPGGGKAEYLDDKENPRFVVISLESESWPAQKLYEEMYCPRRHGKSHQRTIFFVRQSRERRKLPGQTTAYLLLRPGIRPAPRATTLRTARNRTGASAMLHGAPEAAQDRRPDSHQRTPHSPVAGQRLSRSRPVSAHLPASPGHTLARLNLP